MKRYTHRHKYHKEKIVGISLAAIGFIIFINSVAIRFLLFIISVILLIMGGLLFMK